MLRFRPPRSPIVVLVAPWLLTGLLASGGCQPKDPGAQGSAETITPVRVDTAAVREAPMPVTLTLTGALRPEREARLAASVAGRVLKLHVDRGSLVKQGQVLAELDVSAASLSAAEASKAAQASKVQREMAKKDCERAQKLFDGGAISKSELDLRRSQCDSADLGVEAAGLRAAIGAQVIRDASVRAPFAGVVETRATDIGEYLMPGSPVVTLVSVENLRLDIVVPEAQLARIALDSTVEFTVSSYPDRRFAAQVRVVGAMVRPGTRDVLVEASVANADRALKPGMFTTVEIVTAHEPMPLVPLSAIVKRGDASHLFVVVDGRAHERVVQLGPRRADEVAVVRGVAIGDRVVPSPPEALRNGSTVSEGG